MADTVLSPLNAAVDLGSVVERIKREIHRSRALDDDAVKMAICTAIQHYSGRRFYFNEGNYTFLTVADQQEYEQESEIGAQDGYPADLLRIDVARIDVDSGTTNAARKYVLERRNIIEIRDFDSYATPSGQPAYFCWHNRKIFLWPPPSTDDWEVTLDYVKDIGTPIYKYSGGSFSYLEKVSAASVTDSWNSDWFVEAEELIRARAKWDIYLNLYRDYSAAEGAKILEEDALRSLEADSDNFQYPGGAVAWGF